MSTYHDLQRFVNAHAASFKTALDEIQSGKKQTHWSWFVFPQIVGLGKSETSVFYSIQTLDEARSFLKNPTLRANFIKILEALLEIKESSAKEILGTPDDLKLHSSVTLFQSIAPYEETFGRILNRFFQGRPDPKTLEILNQTSLA
jgi:uncharacterized protein (DUF1810 family)